MFRFIKAVFIAFLSFNGSLASTTKASDWTKYIFLRNQPCMNIPTLAD